MWLQNVSNNTESYKKWLQNVYNTTEPYKSDRKMCPI
jgi:hypothetical protein